MESSSASLSEPVEQRYTAVPESADVGDGYFDDAVFIGDSLMMGLGAYGVVDKVKVLADIGLNLDTVLSKQCITTPTGMVTVLDAVNLKKPGKIYLMMGSNESPGLHRMIWRTNWNYFSMPADGTTARV